MPNGEIELKWPGKKPPKEVEDKGSWLEPALKGVEWAISPWTASGEWTRQYMEAVQQKPWLLLVPGLQPGMFGAAEATKALTEGEPSPSLKTWLPGGAEFEEYRQLPLWQQLAYEAPAWAGVSALPISALRGWRAAAALPTPARIAVRTALAPVAGAEVAVGAVLKYGVILPLKYGVAKPLIAGTRKTFELALDTGLDKWLIRQGIRGEQANSVIRFFLEKNNRWLYQTAEANWLRRLAEKRGIQQTAKVAAEDTIKEAEPLLLQAIKDAGVKAPRAPKLKPEAELPIGVTEKPIIEAPIPGGITYLPAPASTITGKQVTQITDLLTAKALISASGKFTPQFKRLIKVYTGKTKLLATTEDEANIVIEALERLPEPRYVKGKLVPPSIPASTAIVPGNFFNLKFERPTPIKYFTSQIYYSQKLGLKPLVEPLELAKQRFDLEYNALQNTIAAKVQEIDKFAGTSLAEKAAAKVKNVPTDAVAKMRDLLDEYENAPDLLSLEEAKLFGWFRNLNRTMLNGENEVRRLLGMPEIPYRQAYVRHVAEGLAYEILAGKYPLPEGLKYWSSQIVGKKVYNPMEMARKLAVDLEQYFTKDLGYATRSMVYTALKEIHLSQPLSAFTRQLSAISKDMPIYKHLSAEELAILQKTEIIPAATKKWAIDYVNQVIKGQPTGFDEAVNRMLINRGLAAVFNKFLRPFGRSLGPMPITKLARLQGRMVIAGAMGWRPKQLIRNKFQWTQNLALYGLRANLRAIFPPTGTLKELMNESLFLKGYTGMEELPVDIQAKLEKMWLAPFQWTAKTNAMDGMKAAFWNTEKLITNPKYKEYGWADPKRTYTEPKDFFYPSEKEMLLKEMEFGAGCTQYQYIGMGMPEVFRNKVLIPFTRLQSWWMNYFFKFHREAITRAFTGRTSYGASLPWSMRLNWFKYLILGGAILIPMGYSASYLWGVLPSRFAPTFQMTVALYQYATADTEYEKARAMRQMFNAWHVLVPGALAFKDFKAVFTGEKPIKSLFFYSSEGGVIYTPEEAGWKTPSKGISPYAPSGGGSPYGGGGSPYGP